MNTILNGLIALSLILGIVVTSFGIWVSAVSEKEKDRWLELSQQLGGLDAEAYVEFCGGDIASLQDAKESNFQENQPCVEDYFIQEVLAMDVFTLVIFSSGLMLLMLGCSIFLIRYIYRKFRRKNTQ